ncbi:MAG: ABC transporter ATP-binding protein [Anaerolineae bacterium]|nr:ABC transporter ATP-binding protein [Anaerolineae bacterium]MCA9886712.1 ABC transporter ATP-binding protein [Anaerolineae bacterium]MCA9891337.1 ABC transporter ATP-binding protein [Anaerolineae bacterium]
MTQDVALQVNNLRVHYHTQDQAVKAVDDVTFSLYAGERLGIVGESGSGKSTLALALMRLHKPPAKIEGGEVFLGETDILKINREQMRHVRWSKISFIPQGSMNSLNPVIKIKHQMADVIKAHQQGWSQQKISDRISDLLGRVGLSNSIADMYPHELSGGMKQRVCIALAIVLEPRVIIADEPTSALDVVVQRVVIQTLNDIQQQLNAAMIIIGHDMGLMAQSVDRLAVMYAGKMVDVSPVSPFFSDPLHPYSRLLISSLPSPDEKRELTGIPGMQPSLLDLPSGCAFHPRCPIAVEKCRQQIPPLRQIEESRRTACHLVEEKLR